VASPKPDQLVTNPSVKPVIEPTNPTRYRQAIVLGKAALASENSKAAAARVIFQELVDEPREVVLRAFIEGANVTPKGSPTYFYNISRKFKRLKNQAVKT
jgi:hypothetical protein